MTQKDQSFHPEPGLVLYEVVLGTFKSSGTTFEVWCKQNATNVTMARNALKGVNSGPTGTVLLGRLIDGAGREVVELAYRKRLEQHVAKLNAASAQTDAAA
ncbi:hypothetical protein AN189_03040 [Loktanella sp. 3ANDIMAR09]|uniref:hypothetical protein n=1 Tax=Loktanella sp. 3ANDIMAR09 TaxID=1225657 RepID=UPI0006FBD256|nr:hypothetical protein [Loktanella sp. 3ANDIMAR09]KQI69412.1 hypothetical protein AN189_03040 [Loktanella sp. 3ANDIMAR09]